MIFYDSRNLFAQSTWTLLKIYKFDKSQVPTEYALMPSKYINLNQIKRANKGIRT